ncbi:MAG: 6-phosphogluconolactonase [Candidatus Rokubacteria bacterium]|nr:6-phosphogluconolactonase [Candidatus Rokubacteria bacterium]
MELVVSRDAAALAHRAAEHVLDRVRAKPDFSMAVLQETHARAPIDFSRFQVFAVDELCPPAPPDGYFWRQVGKEFLAWAGVPPERQRPFRVDRPDLDQMCREYEETIARAGGLDLVMLGLGPNGHIASNEPGSPFDSRCRPVGLLASTVDYILTDAVIQGAVSDRAVTLGIATILEAREVVVLVSGAGKREPLAKMLDGPITPDVPASALKMHPRCVVLADEASLAAPSRR